MSAALRLYITGGPGSGKSRAAIRVAERYAIDAYCLDEMVWDNSRGRRGLRFPTDQRDAAVRQLAKRPAWVAEGTYFQEWLEPLLARAHSVIVLDTPPLRRLFRLVRRHFFERPPGRGLRAEVKLFLANARWGWGYEKGPRQQLLRYLQQSGTPYRLIEEGDILQVVDLVYETLPRD